MATEKKRTALALPTELYRRLAALATVEGKPTATFAREIIAEYLDSRAADVEEALKFVAGYQDSLKAFRAKNAG